MRFKLFSAVLVSSAFAASSFAGSVFEFDFFGNGGEGLLPSNEVGNNTSLGSDSLAIGGETGGGITFNTETNQLAISFDFSGLTGGLFDAASGIHLHRGQPGADPFNETGPIVFNLNSFGLNDNVFNDNAPIAFGETGGEVSALINVVDEELQQALFDGELYLNIHSASFTGGELRANVVLAGGAQAVPTPTAVGGGMLLLLGMLQRRRRAAAVVD